MDGCSFAVKMTFLYQADGHLISVEMTLFFFADPCLFAVKMPLLYQADVCLFSTEVTLLYQAEDHLVAFPSSMRRQMNHCLLIVLVSPLFVSLPRGARGDVGA